MRLKSIFISRYKNLKNFDLVFEGDGFIDIFVGRNGSGKSNFLEALIAIFEHLYGFAPDGAGPGFDYKLSYEIDGREVLYSWSEGTLAIDGRARRSLSGVPLPDSILVYYSGQNATVAELVRSYEDMFRARIKSADFGDSPEFVGIGPSYRQLLITILMLQPDDTLARQYLCQKLRISSVDPDIKLILTRPIYAQGSDRRRYDIDDVDGDRFWKPEGITKDFLERLSRCQSPPPRDGRVRSDGYFQEPERYILYLDIEKLRAEFLGLGPADLFQQFNNLKILGMLADVSIVVSQGDNQLADLGQFSDGQFQSVYLFAISELFKDRNCVTLLDEPDAFLHPEWQFDFLKQTHAISEKAAKTNHILMTSHSASTVAAKVASRVRMMEFNGEKIEAVEREKGELIKSLSAGLITFSEQEARLSLDFILANTTGPVLFTEGPSDVLILETAWQKLNPGKTCPVEIVQAFDRSFLRNTIMRMAHPDKNTGRIIFALFDFDEAYQDWKQLGAQVEEDIEKCLTRKKDGREIYSLLLPVPPGLSTRNQVWNAKTGRTFEDESHLPIELLFRDVAGLEKHFEVDPKDRAGWTRFIGDKVKFAEERVPSIEAAHFEVFRPIFDFIESKTN
ncbi:ATP-dependent nuclease [Rhizobium changzhiense]|nr:AAA family ATPase [Rhizobium changzhiense]